MTSLCKYIEQVYAHPILVKSSTLHGDLQACYAYFSSDARLSQVSREAMVMNCVPTESEDAADAPAKMIVLARPSEVFLRLPSFTAKAKMLWKFMRELCKDAACDIMILKAFGVQEEPRAADFANASERIASECSGSRWQWEAAVLEMCVQGVHEVVIKEKGDTSVSKLHMLAEDGTCQKASKLVWANVGGCGGVRS